MAMYLARLVSSIRNARSIGMNTKAAENRPAGIQMGANGPITY